MYFIDEKDLFLKFLWNVDRQQQEYNDLLLTVVIANLHPSKTYRVYGILNTSINNW